MAEAVNAFRLSVTFSIDIGFLFSPVIRGLPSSRAEKVTSTLMLEICARRWYAPSGSRLATPVIEMASSASSTGSLPAPTRSFRMDSRENSRPPKTW